MLTATNRRRCDETLERLNNLSLTRSFTPHLDIDWDATTTDAEYESLYSSWSLLEGTGVDGSLDATGRAKFVKYQQINLLTFIGLMERHAITFLARLYDLDSSRAFTEYVGHFIKEETYHYAMNMRAAKKIESTMPGSRRLPTKAVDRTLRWLFRLINAIPGKKVRCAASFTFFRFAEQVTIFAQQMVHSKIPRRESFINQIWDYHALDEVRHLAFDSIVLERSRPSWPVGWVPRALAAPCCVILSALLNVREVWFAQQLGVRVHLWQLPMLMRRTTAPFKRRVFGLLVKTVLGRDLAA